MTQISKTDNGNLVAKLELRRHFLRKYHADGKASILDCCQGGGVIWSQLRSEFAVARYWGVDVKPKKGRLGIDSVRILEQPGWMQNVIDVDTYGEPWPHWFAVLRNLSQPTTVFLTAGKKNNTTASNQVLGLAGIRFKRAKLPLAIRAKLYGRLTDFAMFTIPPSVRIVEAAEAGMGRECDTRYIGIRVEPVGPL